MTIELNHTIVPAHDKEASAKWLAEILGARYEGAHSHFAVVRINERLTLDYDHFDHFNWHHYAFKVEGDEFDRIFERIGAKKIAYGSQPDALDDMTINHRRGGRGFYFLDPNGHIMEVFTG
ncbi:MAG TPA: VOC family protein [Stellaceae bacterium]|nr:VOC family protein [Stellaceae bacterium]